MEIVTEWRRQILDLIKLMAKFLFNYGSMMQPVPFKHIILLSQKC